jgi:hypothetical protein
MCARLSFATSGSALGANVPSAVGQIAWAGLTSQTFGHIGNYYDLTVGNTGLLMGVGNTVATVPSALSPLFVAHTLHAYGPKASDHILAWSRVFACLSGVALCMGFVYSRMVEVDVVDGTDRERQDASAGGRGKEEKASHKV